MKENINYIDLPSPKESVTYEKPIISDITNDNKINEKIPEIYLKETLDLSKLSEYMKYTYDYEINNVKLENESNINDINIENSKNGLNTKIYYYDKELKTERILNYNNFKDNLISQPFEPPKNAYSASIIKHLVSKKKRRFQNEEYDLDMIYITERVIAMGFPSTGCEKIYRNDVSDVVSYFEKYHKGNVKIYNLCLEKDRIYPKNLFNKCKVALFPSLDHNPCPVKLILEFCVDICLFLIQNIESVAAVHCKAGKGRTGVMICCYLFFSGLCKNSDEALNYYGLMRTKNMKGVTISSQRRYIKYFETFLRANFYPPFFYLIPKIIKEYLYINNKPPKIKNLLINLQNDSRYFLSPNSFRINSIKVGPLENENILGIKIENFTHTVFKFPKESFLTTREIKLPNKNTGLYFRYETNCIDFPIHSDIKITVSNGVDFYICLNLWYSTLLELNRYLKLYDINNKNNLLNEGLNLIDNPQKEKNIDVNNNKNINNINNLKNEIMIEMDDKTEINKTLKNSINDDSDELVINKNGFLIFNEDDINYENLLKNKKCDLNNEKIHNTLISTMQKDKDLNNMILYINEILEKKNKKKIDKNNITIILEKKELDKFKQKNKISNLNIEINYSIK